MARATDSIITKRTYRRVVAGERQNRLVAIQKVERHWQKQPVWLFQCDCGNTHIAQPSSVRIGHIKSCGCLHSETSTENGKATKTHGLRNSKEYNTWCAMRARCQNVNSHKYPSYGGRGIAVCPEWEQFEVFYSDMGPKPSPAHSIERIDNDGHYEPSNCRWATPTEQRMNQRPRRSIEGR